jgi:large subunit ribosomal protein L15
MAKNLSNLRAPKKANTGRKRVGRGMGSGMGKTSTRGHKGQGSRSGFSLMRGFEGGQMPLHRRLPKRGFTNIFRTEYTVVNLDRIASRLKDLKVTEIGLDDYKKLGLASSKKALIKILGSGELTSAITIHAHKFSKSAVEKIEKAGGKAVVLGGAVALRQRPKSSVFKGTPWIQILGLLKTSCVTAPGAFPGFPVGQVESVAR